jgi:NTE family protein
MAPTSPKPRSPRRRPRIGLALGGGGVLGAAWMAGALTALQERLDRPLHDVDIIVGTSAGSVLAAALRCGVAVDEIVAHQRGATMAALPALGDIDRESGWRPPLPRLRLGSTRLLASAARAPHRVHPWVAASALLPQGRAQHRTLTGLVHALLAQSDGRVPPAELHWPGRPTWVISVDYESGRRVAFGREGAPAAPLPDAVVASCSIPGWHEPKVIGERRYVDGGLRSNTSVDLLSRVPLDEVYVLAPMASYETDRPRNPALRAERFVRQLIANALTREVRKVQAAGATVRALTPGPEDLAAMGLNMMDPARRAQVLETSLLTSLARWGTLDGRAAAA